MNGKGSESGLGQHLRNREDRKEAGKEVRCGSWPCTDQTLAGSGRTWMQEDQGGIEIAKHPQPTQAHTAHSPQPIDTDHQPGLAVRITADFLYWCSSHPADLYVLW